MPGKKSYRIIPVITLPAKEEKRDYSNYIRMVWEYRRMTAAILILFVTLAVFITIFETRYYTANVILLPEYNVESQRGANLFQDLGPLAGLAGGLGIQTYRGTSDAVRTELYPEIITSVPVLKKLIYEEFLLDQDHTEGTLFTYLNEIWQPSPFDYITAYTIRLPQTVLSWIQYLLSEREPVQVADAGRFAETRLVYLDREEAQTIEFLKQSIAAEISPEYHTLHLSVTLPDAELSAAVAQRLIDLLTEYVTGYRTAKLSDDLDFFTNRKDEAQLRFLEVQEELALFRDRNRDLSSNRAKIREERLRSEYNMAFELLTTLTGQREELQIHLQEETPLFKVLEPATVPITPSHPRPVRNVLFALVIGLLVSVIMITYYRVKPALSGIVSSGEKT